MANMKNMNRLPRLIDLIENSINIPTFSEMEAEDLAFGLNCFFCQKTSIGHQFQGVDAIHQFFEPFWPTNRGSLKQPIVNLVCVGFCCISEDDLVGHVLRGIPIQTFSEE